MLTKKIVTITLNPSVDISYQLDELKLDTVNRCDKVDKTAGGKGLNVSKIVHLLGGELVATGFLGGTIGAFIKEDLDRYGIAHDFCEIKAESRNCIAMLHEGKQTEILESGPTLDQEDGQRFLEKLDSLLENAAVVTISGSLPKGIKEDYYHQIIQKCYNKSIPVLCDSSGGALKFALENDPKPFLIKPNDEEITDLIGEEIDFSDISQMKTVLSHPLFQGIPWVVISLGKDGAFVKCQDAYYKVDIPEIEVVSPVGSGDATVAGLAYSIKMGKMPEETLKLAMACGMLNSLEEKTGWMDPSRITEFTARIHVTKV